MHIISKSWAALLVAQLLIAPLAVLTAPSVASATIACSPENTTLNIVAHEDDSLLFQSPDLLHGIQQNDVCSRTVFMTAGDAGAPESYWAAREDGVKAAYADMAGVADAWNQSDASIMGQTVHVFTLAGKSNVSIIFLRLPDGSIDGEGFSGNGSLQQLWSGAISSINALDGTASYTRDGIISLLNGIINEYQPSRIDTQDFVGTFGDGDHSDHYATGKFVQNAHISYSTQHVLNAYRGYGSASEPVNVTGDDLAAKIHAFFAYAPHDTSSCQTYDTCGIYADWLNRQYIVGSESGGAPDMCSNLSGNQTVVPNGYIVSGGQCVVNPEICQSVVSDTSDMTGADVHAVEAFVSPLWTAGANIPGALWIWNAFHTADPANGETVIFTKDITVTGTLTTASITIASDDNYEASFNGTQFAAVTDIDNYTAGNEDTYDVSALLHEGSNQLVITAHNIATGDMNPEVNPAGIRYKLDITKSSCVNAAPVVTLNGSATVSLYVGDAYTEAGATATDAEDGTLTPVISGSVNTAAVGVYTLTYTATDSGSLTGSATRTVNVIAKSNGGGSSSGGGGGAVFIPGLQINNKTKTILKPSGNILVAWSTNMPAYGHVVYGVDTGTPYVLDITKPNFGYPQSTPTDPSIAEHLDPQGKIMNHSYVLTGLIPGKTYRYRAISHASPPIMSDEDTFTVPADASFTDATTGTGTVVAVADTTGTTEMTGTTTSSGGKTTTTPSVSGTDTSGAETTTAQQTQEISADGANADTSTGTPVASSSTNLAAAFAALNALAGVKLWQWAILVLAVGGAIYFILWKRKKDGETI